MKYTILFAMISCLVSISCKTKKVVSPSQHEGKRLIFSHGGGFAGTFKTYHILDNGQVFRKTSEFEKVEAVKDLPRQQATQIFSNYAILGFGNQDIQSYGNLNYSITMVEKDGKEHKLIWEKNQEGTEKLQLFYTNVMDQIRKNRAVEDEAVK